MELVEAEEDWTIFEDGEGHLGAVADYQGHYEGHPFSGQFVHGMYWLGRALTWGVTHAIEAFFKVIVLPFRPGSFGQGKTRTTEVLKRVWFVIKALMLFPITLPVFPVGCALRALATRTKKDMLFVRPRPSKRTASHNKRTTQGEKKKKGGGSNKRGKKGKEKEEEAEDVYQGLPKKLKVWTQNLGFIPFVSSFNNLMSPSQRMELLLEEILSCDDDIVCMQEQFHVGLDQRFRARLGCGGGTWNGFELDRSLSLYELEEGLGASAKPPFRWMISDCGSSSRRLNSGLTILSRFPLEAPEFTQYTNCTGDDRWAAKGVLGCTVLLGRNPHDSRGYAKATLFITHTDAGSNRVVHKQQFRTASSFIKYYNSKYIGRHDLAVTSLLAGDFNISPLNYHNNGKLAEDPEWAINSETWDGDTFVNMYYANSEEGNLRRENMETWLAFQELFFSELQSAGRNKDGKGQEIWMDADGLLKGIKKLLARKATGKEKGRPDDIDEDTEGEMESFLKQEITRMLQRRFGEVYSPASFRTSRLQEMGELVRRLHLIPKRDGDEERPRFEHLLPGSSIDTKTPYHGLFPKKVDHNDLDHILVQQRIVSSGGNVTEGVARTGRFSLAKAALTFSDHMGKRLSLKLQWQQARPNEDV